MKVLVVVANRLNKILLPEGLRIGFDGINPKLVELAPSKPESVPAKGAHPAIDFVKLTKDITLAGLLESRKVELDICMANQAYLAAIILMDTILEGVLLSLVHQHPKEANSSAKVPKDAEGKPRHFVDWTLTELVEVSHDCKWIRLAEAWYIYLLKEYRQLIHPWEQRARNQIPNAKDCKKCYQEFIEVLMDIQK